MSITLFGNSATIRSEPIDAALEHMPPIIRKFMLFKIFKNANTI